LNNINRDKDKQTNELTVLHEKYNSIQQTNDLLIKEVYMRFNINIRILFS